MNNVVQFPTGKLAANVERHLVDLLARMTAAGLTPEQQIYLLIQSAKDIGCVEIDGVWQLPERTSDE